MNWIDGHLDLAYIAARGRDLTLPCDNPETGCVSLPDLKEGNITIAFGTIYTDPEEPDAIYGYNSSEDIDGAENAALWQMDYYETLEREGHILIVRNKNDLAKETNKLKIVILMEGADPIRSPSHAEEWFKRGVRLVGMTWAMGSRYAGGNAKHGPLTSEGRELVAAFDELGIIHDISHLADKSVEELFAISNGKIVATHSNCRSLLWNNQRHITDDYILEIASRNGIVGLNLFTQFLAKGRRATIDDAIPHVLHIAELMGHRKGVGLGSDADGGFPPTDLPDGLDHPRKFNNLIECLLKEGWSEEDTKGFTHDNWYRYLSENLPS